MIRLVENIAHRATCSACNSPIDKGETVILYRQPTDVDDKFIYRYHCHCCSVSGVIV